MLDDEFPFFIKDSFLKPFCKFFYKGGGVLDSFEVIGNEEPTEEVFSLIVVVLLATGLCSVTKL